MSQNEHHKQNYNNKLIFLLANLSYFIYESHLIYLNISKSAMSSVDYVMVVNLVGLYIGVTSLFLINMFIAVLSNTVSRVYEKATGFIQFQKAVEIVKEEKAMSLKERSYVIKLINKSYNPFYGDPNHIDIGDIKDRKIMEMDEH